MLKQPISKMWYFPSSSGSATYETLQYEDGSISCNCMGWTRRVAADGSRSCKHTRLIESGRAGVPAMDYTAGVGYAVGDMAHPTPVKAKTKPVKATPKPTPEPVDKKIPIVRKIQWE